MSYEAHLSGEINLNFFFNIFIELRIQADTIRIQRLCLFSLKSERYVKWILNVRLDYFTYKYH